jgi:hypothetical protein
MNMTSNLQTNTTRPADRLIGYVGRDVPVELILAAGATPLGIHGRADQLTPQADRYLEPTFTASSRSIAEQWLNGEFDRLDAVLFSRSDDSAQRLYYYLCELQRRGMCAGPRPLMYDIAAHARDSSLTHTITSTRQLARELGASDDALMPSVERVRERSGLLMATVDSTTAKAAARGSFTQRMLRAADRDWSFDFDQTLRSAQDSTPLRPDAMPLMLIGSTPADEQLHESAERAGGNIVATLNAATPYQINETTTQGDAFEQIARRCRAHPWRQMLQSPQDFCARARELRVAGVILWVVAEDTGLAWVYPRLERALREHAIPVLPMTMQKWNVPAETLDAVASFASTLRTRG